MGITILEILGAIFQITGFMYLCHFGVRLGDTLQAKSKWLRLGIAALAIAIAVAICCAAEQPLHFAAQTVAVLCVGFGGGLLARERNRITGE
jgi:hypothetical protein